MIENLSKQVEHLTNILTKLCETKLNTNEQQNTLLLETIQNTTME